MEGFSFPKKVHFYNFVFVGAFSCAGDKIEKNEMGWACGAYG